MQQILYFYLKEWCFIQRNDVKVKINFLKSNICFPRLLCNASVFPEEIGSKVPATWLWNEQSQGNFPDVQVCSSVWCPVSEIQLNIWTERKISLPFILVRGNLVSENISHISKLKWTKPKALIVRWRPAVWNVQSSGVSRPLELHRGCGEAKHV